MSHTCIIFPIVQNQSVARMQTCLGRRGHGGQFVSYHFVNYLVFVISGILVVCHELSFIYMEYLVVMN